MQLQKKLLEVLFRKSPKKLKQEEETNKDANLGPFKEENFEDARQEEKTI